MEWIRTEDETPFHNEIVLCADILNEFITLGKYDEEEDCFILMNIEKLEIDSYPTHWMPLPEPPGDL